MATKYPSDSQPLVNLGGRPPALKPEHIVVMRDIVAERALNMSVRSTKERQRQRIAVRLALAPSDKRIELKAPMPRGFIPKEAAKS
jgi:hypothetical protein